MQTPETTTKPEATLAESREERKKRLREIAGRVAKMTDQEREQLAARVLATNLTTGDTLSTHNLCLLAYQLPSATIVGGFHAWIKNGRCVRKGEHGAVIWVPTGRKNKETNEIEGEPRGFVLGTVFDVSQTVALEERKVA